MLIAFFWLWWHPDFFYELNVYTGWIPMTFGLDIHVQLRIHCKSFGEPMTLHLA